MPEQIELLAGAAAQGGSTPAQEDIQGMLLIADGSPHRCGWTIYVPEELRNASPLILTLTFLDEGTGGGNARLTLNDYRVDDDATFVSGGTIVTTVTMLNDSTKLISITTNITDWVNINTTLLIVSIIRDSSHADDTFNNTLVVFNGRISG